MVSCLIAELAFTSVARRDAVLTQLTNRVVDRACWGDSRIEASTTMAGAPAIRLELRFINALDEEDLRNTIEAQATGVRTPMAGSWYETHSCRHDEGVGSCVADPRRVW